MWGVETLPVGRRVAPPGQDRPAQLLLLRTAHKDSKFSLTSPPALPQGTVPLSSGATSLSGPGSLVRPAHGAVFNLRSVNAAWGRAGGHCRGCGSWSPAAEVSHATGRAALLLGQETLCCALSQIGEKPRGLRALGCRQLRPCPGDPPKATHRCRAMPASVCPHFCSFGTAVFAFTRHPALSKQRAGRGEQLAGMASAGRVPTAASPCSPRCRLCNKNVDPV